MSPPGARLPPALPNDLVEEVLVRFPPDDPALLVRTALVCKDWCCLISNPGFRRRLRQRHRTPALLGYFHHGDGLPNFKSTSSFLPPYAAARRGWSILNARHGRVLVLHKVSLVAPVEKELIVWDPITDKQHRLPMPPFNYMWNWNAALLCAAAGCDHLDCPWGPFLVVFVCTKAFMVSACVYSSEQGAWREPISTHHHACNGLWVRGHNVLIGNTIYFGCQVKAGILEYDLGKQEVSMIGLPPVYHMRYFVLMTAEGGELGCINGQDSKLCLWSRVAGPSGYVTRTWALQRVIELDKVPPFRDPSISPNVYIVANADDIGVVFIWVDKELFTVDLKSSRAEKVGNVIFIFGIVPYMDFYTPALRTTFTGEGGRSRCLK